ncbi:hypothetical protein HN832_04155 [archaeon]|nr:hypothetical protein [archaeon]MBT4373413.1 hypothetical protein [archaeon]MBT4531861.1 hypothetical protein [archaeon]MBT7001528.1 hypothetical protein [archaeon]MBT7282580.1 hypothetical protein [archaeon]
MKMTMMQQIPAGLTPGQIKRKYGSGNWNLFVQIYPDYAYDLFSQLGLADLGRAILNECSRKEISLSSNLLEEVQLKMDYLNEKSSRRSVSYMGSTEPGPQKDNAPLSLNWRDQNVWEGNVRSYEESGNNTRIFL